MGSFRSDEPPALVEPVAIGDTFATGLAKIENLGGGLYRFWLCVEQAPLDGGPPERIIVAKIVGPGSGLPKFLRQLAAEFGEKILAGLGMH
jgi:hypothetical protein